MNRESIRKLLERMNIHVRASDANGITIGRVDSDIMVTCEGYGEHRKVGFGGSYYQQDWRLHCGSGIAGNSNQWWLQYDERGSHGRLLGPFNTAKALEAELRRWRRWESP
jgi:hypothetical protein